MESTLAHLMLDKLNEIALTLSKLLLEAKDTNTRLEKLLERTTQTPPAGALQQLPTQKVE